MAEFLSNRKKSSKEDNLIASRDLIAAANPGKNFTGQKLLIINLNLFLVKILKCFLC